MSSGGRVSVPRGRRAALQTRSPTPSPMPPLIPLPLLPNPIAVAPLLSDICGISLLRGWQAVEPLWGGRRGKGVWMGMQGKGRAGQSGGGSLCKEFGIWGVGCCVGGGESCWARSGRAAVRGGRGVWDVACGAWDKRSRRCGRGGADVFRGRSMASWNA